MLAPWILHQLQFRVAVASLAQGTWAQDVISQVQLCCAQGWSLALLTLAHYCNFPELLSTKGAHSARFHHEKDRKGDGKGTEKGHDEASKGGHNSSGKSSSSGSIGGYAMVRGP